MKSRQTISPKQFAAALGVSESSIKRWCDQGNLPVSRTPGGHRRIPIDAAVNFARKSGRPIARPELLGIPTSRRSGPLKELLPLFTRELLDGNEQTLREMTYDLFIQHGSLANIFDEVLNPSLATISRGCTDGSVKEYERRRALSIMLSVLTELRGEITPAPNGPLACGGTIDNESQGVCSKMVEVLLRSEGWRTFSLGAVCPSRILLEAAREMKPSLVWFGTSARAESHVTDFPAEARIVATEMNQLGIPVFIGCPYDDKLTGLPSSATVSNSFSEMVTLLRKAKPTHDKS